MKRLCVMKRIAALVFWLYLLAVYFTYLVFWLTVCWSHRRACWTVLELTVLLNSHSDPNHDCLPPVLVVANASRRNTGLFCVCILSKSPLLSRHHIVHGRHECPVLLLAKARTSKSLSSDVQVKTKSEKLARAEEGNAELSALLTAERKAAKLAGAAAQKQLLGSMRRIQYMVSIIDLYYISLLVVRPHAVVNLQNTSVTLRVPAA